MGSAFNSADQGCCLWLCYLNPSPQTPPTLPHHPAPCFRTSQGTSGSEVQDDGGGRGSRCPALRWAGMGGGFRPPRRSRITTLSRVSGGGGDPQTLLLKWVPILDDSDVTDVMQVLPRPPLQRNPDQQEIFFKNSFSQTRFAKIHFTRKMSFSKNFTFSQTHVAKKIENEERYYKIQ